MRSRNSEASVYYLHVGASLLPRQPHGEPMTLAEALHGPTGWGSHHFAAPYAIPHGPSSSYPYPWVI